MAQINDILSVYEQEIRKNMKDKKQVLEFERQKMIRIGRIQRKIEKLDQEWKVHYHIFLIQEPKERVIMSLDIENKIINHYITRYLLIPKLTHRLNPRNVATRKGYGTNRGRKLLRKYIIEKKEKTFYFLKMDISKYFYHIDHKVLLELMKPYLNEKELKIMENIIKSINEDYINEKIESFKKDLPLYQFGKELPIGNMTSQFLAIYYLNELDHQIVHDYPIKSYVRYMDDFLLIHENKEYLKEIKKKIEQELKEKYQLTLNPKKTKITSSKEGVVFLGYHYRVKDNRFIMTLTGKKKAQIRKITKSWKKRKQESVLASFQTILNGNKVGRKYKKRWIEKGIREFQKKKNQ